MAETSVVVVAALLRLTGTETVDVLVPFLECWGEWFS